VTVDSRRQIRGSSLLLAGRVLSLVTNLVVQVLIVRTLSKEGYGVFAYALSIATIGEGLVSLGLHRAVARYVPLWDEEGDRARALGTLLLSIGATLGTGVAAVLLVWAFRGAIAGDLATQPGAIASLVILSTLAPLQGLDRLMVGVFSSFGNPRAIFLRRFVLTPGLRLLVVGVLVVQGGGVVILAVGYAGAGVVGVALYGSLLLSLLRRRGYLGGADPVRPIFPAREIFGFALPLLTTEIVFAAINQADAVMLGHLAGAGDVASLRSVVPVARLNQVVLEMFAVLFTPIAARMFQRRDFAGVNELYWNTTRWVALLSFPIFAGTFALARPLATTLFGDRYAASGPLLAVLAFAFYAHASLGPNGMVLNVYKRLRWVVSVNIVAFLVNIVANFWAIPRYGAMGAAVATAGTLVLHNLLKQIGLRGAEGMRALDPVAIRTFASIAMGTSALVVLEIVVRPGAPVAAGAAALVSAAVFAANRRALDLAGTFPEVARLPIVGKWLGGGR
jgi:O-antigen/teichoic acid export membrane protein